jgi:hypothetical protein
MQWYLAFKDRRREFKDRTRCALKVEWERLSARNYEDWKALAPFEEYWIEYDGQSFFIDISIDVTYSGYVILRICAWPGVVDAMPFWKKIWFMRAVTQYLTKEVPIVRD